ncbi:hypothetical protein LCGC14_1574190, partial [marine sediment metagenome]
MTIFHSKTEMNTQRKIDGKCCSKCSIFKEYKYFNKTKKIKDGYRSACKRCLSKLEEKRANKTKAIIIKQKCNKCN